MSACLFAETPRTVFVRFSQGVRSGISLLYSCVLILLGMENSGRSKPALCVCADVCNVTEERVYIDFDTKSFILCTHRKVFATQNLYSFLANNTTVGGGA